MDLNPQELGSILPTALICHRIPLLRSTAADTLAIKQGDRCAYNYAVLDCAHTLAKNDGALSDRFFTLFAEPHVLVTPDLDEQLKVRPEQALFQLIDAKNYLVGSLHLASFTPQELHLEELVLIDPPKAHYQTTPFLGFGINAFIAVINNLRHYAKEKGYTQLSVRAYTWDQAIHYRSEGFVLDERFMGHILYKTPKEQLLNRIPLIKKI